MPLTQWPVLAAVLLVLGVVVWLQRRQQIQVREQLSEHMKMASDLMTMVGFRPGAGRDPDGSGSMQALGGAADPLLTELRGIRGDVAALSNRVGIVENDVKWLRRQRDPDSDRPAKVRP